MDTTNHMKPHPIELKKPKTDILSKGLTDICFGDLSREEINIALTLAGVPLNPPKKVSQMAASWAYHDTV
jgi:hypothetical protein